MTLEEYARRLETGDDPHENGMQDLIDTLRSDGYRVVKLEYGGFREPDEHRRDWIYRERHATDAYLSSHEAQVLERVAEELT